MPLEYLIIDDLAAYEQAPAVRRYSIPVVQAFRESWRLLYARPDSGGRIYRRVLPPR